MQSSAVCVDASVVVRLVADPGDAAVRDLWARWDAEGAEIHAPTLLFYEVSNALYRYLRAGVLSRNAIDGALDAALTLPVQLHGDAYLHGEAVDLAARLRLGASYDAHYLALADRLRAELWTADQRLVNAVGTALPWLRLAGISN